MIHEKIQKEIFNHHDKNLVPKIIIISNKQLKKITKECEVKFINLKSFKEIKKERKSHVFYMGFRIVGSKDLKKNEVLIY